MQPVPAGKGKGRKPTEYSARELFDILQTGIKVKFFVGIKGSDGILKARLQELLVFHEDPVNAPAAIRDVITGTSYEISFGAPLDLLAAEKRLFENTTDAEKEKLLKKAEDGKIGGNAIRNASLTTMTKSKSRGSAVVRASDSGDDVEIVQGTVPCSPHAMLAPSTPMVPFAQGPEPIRDWSPPLDDYAGQFDVGDDSDVECIGYKAAPEETSPAPVKIKAEPAPANIPTSTPANAKAKKLSTPFASIPRDDKTSKKRIKREGSDDENVPPRSTKRVRNTQSFDLKAFLLEERQHREKFEHKMLQQMAQSSDNYRKSADNTEKFQNNFLTFLERAFEPKN
ncbi:hypothetical protein B0H10DRAFT_2106852 [Mycena sp. CBHHK59/15]|nr:hypothetical protein B0H10DRAFT_2106852 [Mycena sp. CBHHK59/15]